jgi:hypothetical protein
MFWTVYYINIISLSIYRNGLTTCGHDTNLTTVYISAIVSPSLTIIQRGGKTVSISIFETRRANVRFGDDAYGPLNVRLRKLIVGECEKTLSGIKSHLCLRWNITETVLHDEDAETVPDDYPVLLVEAEIIFRDKLWLEKRCPYLIVVDNTSVYMLDRFHNCFTGGQAHQLIANTLK